MSLDQIFGGSQSVPLLSKDQMKFMTGIYKNVLPTIGKPVDTYTGQTVAGVNPLMQNAMAGYGGATQLNPGVDSALASQLSGAGDAAGVNAMFKSALGPADLAFQDKLAQVGQHYGDTWGRGGAMPMMAGRATSEYGMGLANLLANLTYQDRQAGMDRQAAAIPMALGVRESNQGALNNLFGMGSQQRAIEQQGLLGDYNAWNAKQWYNNPAIPLGMSLMGVQTQGYVNQPGVFNQVVGAGQGLANLGMSLVKPI